MALPKDSTGATGKSDFRVGGQTGEIINNVGGSQNIFVPEAEIVVSAGQTAALTPAERAAAVLGLLLFWGGVALLVALLYSTAHTVIGDVQADDIRSDYLSYVPAALPVPFVLILAGTVVPRLGLRLFGREAGPG